MKGAFNVTMRVVSSLIGVLLALMGGVWILQGLNLAWGPMRQSFMENDRHWAVYGALLALVGICQVIWSNTRQAKAAV
jgi:drug/metabolite transporter superfamily protein YnfA